MVLIQPAAEVSVKVISYDPGFAKQKDEVGPTAVLKPSKFHSHPVTEPELIVDASVKVTHHGAQPATGLDVNIGVGTGNTVTSTVAVTAGEQPSFTVTVYCVVAAGEAEGLANVASFNPAAGDHEYVYPLPAPSDATALMIVEPPGQIDAEPALITESAGLTVTITSSAIAGQPFTSVTFTV